MADNDTTKTRERALRAAIHALEAQVSVLGDEAVAAAIAPLRAQLDALRGDGWRTSQQRLRLVTVLFCDVVGSTRIARRLDPEAIHDVMDTALASLTEVIENEGGNVLQYAGDSILAVFGARESQEEDPRFAIRAGLEMLRTAKHLAATVEAEHAVEGFDIRVGIHSGRVLLGGGVDDNNSIRGMPVNVAARMEQTAPPGALRISHATFRLVRGIFDVVAQPPIAVKGLDRPVRSYLVQSEFEGVARTGSRGVDGVEVRLIGRDRELHTLKQTLRELAKNETALPRMALLSGDAGMGKSRLADEFEVWAATREVPATILHAKALLQTRHQPYGLLRDLFFRWFRIRGGDSASQAKHKFVAALDGLFHEPISEDQALLGNIIGLDLGNSLASALGDPRVARERALRAATRCIERAVRSSRQPLVLVVDDLHWADDDSLTWLQQLLRDIGAAPCLVLGMTRPEFFQQREKWPAEGIDCDVLTLSALSNDDCAALVAELLQRLDHVPTDLRNRLVDAADGNPFYLEERVKILLDDGAIISDGESWRLAHEKLSLDRLPHTLTGILQARIDLLSRAQRRVLRQAAVVGFVFWDEALAAIDPEAPAQLAALERRELIVRQTDSALDGAFEYIFHHHTLHQVTLDSVLKGDRVHYHCCVGRWLELRTQQRPGEFHDRIALHYERGEQPERALHHYVLGSEASASRHSRDATLRFVERGLKLVSATDAANRWRLLISREAMLATADDPHAHDRDLTALAQIADALDDDQKRTTVTWRRAMAQSHAGRYPEALATSEVAGALAERCGDAATAAAIAAIRATALRRLNDFELSWSVAKAGLAQARDCGSLTAQKELLYSLAALAAESGRLDEAVELDDQYIALARQTGDLTAEAIGQNLVGDCLYRRGDLTQAGLHFERSLHLATKIDYAYGKCIAALNLAMVANGRADYPDAVRHARSATQIARRSGSADLEAVSMLQLGNALCGSGEFEPAAEVLIAAGERYEANGSGHLRVETNASLAYVALQNGQRSRAGEYLEKVVEYVSRGGTLDGTEDPVRIRWVCYEVMQALEDRRADDWLADSWALLSQRAAQFDDASSQEAYRQSTVHHRAVTAAWKARA